MAEYIKFRLTAAKVGVTMAFLALLAGLADRAQAAAPPPPPANFLREISIPTGGSGDRIVIQKLDSALATLEHKLVKSYDTAHKINTTFLKIKSANTSFLKIKAADSSFLKIASANTNFLKIDDANSEFLKVDSTASNSNELGGLSPQAFVHGSGNIVTNEATNVGATATSLLNDGSLQVLVANPVGAAREITLVNATGATLSYTESGSSTTGSVPASGQSTPIAMLDGQIELQVFDAASASNVWTITISEANNGNAASFAGQMIIGGA